MKVVIDASVALKWILVETPDEPNMEEATALLQAIDRRGIEVFAPPHWLAEVMAVVSRLAPMQVEPALTLLEEVNPNLISDVGTLRAASLMAAKLGYHLFDTYYHAVALGTGATLVTANDVYHRKAQSLGSILRLSEFPLAT